MKISIVSVAVLMTVMLITACTTTQKIAPEIIAKPDSVQQEIDSLQTQIASIDALIDNTRVHLEGLSLADMAKHDLALTNAETEIEVYKAERQKLEARLAELQINEALEPQSATEF